MRLVSGVGVTLTTLATAAATDCCKELADSTHGSGSYVLPPLVCIPHEVVPSMVSYLGLISTVSVQIGQQQQASLSPRGVLGLL